MNILDITNEDIARLQENKIVFGLLDERDVKILRKIDIHNTESYCASGFYRCRAGASFNGTTVYHIRPDYQLPAPTEADIIAYLQKSEVPPAQWHPAAREWAKRHEGEPIWEHQHADGKSWGKTSFITTGGDELYSFIPHRLRADYGKKDAGYVEFTDPTITNPADIPYGPFTLEPEVCVWAFNPYYPAKCWIGPHNQIRHFADECYKFCPDCGKRIEVKNEPVP